MADAYVIPDDPHSVIIGDGTVLDRMSAQTYGYNVVDDKAAAKRIQDGLVKVYEHDGHYIKVVQGDPCEVSAADVAAGLYTNIVSDPQAFARQSRNLAERKAVVERFEADYQEQQRQLRAKRPQQPEPANDLPQSNGQIAIRVEGTAGVILPDGERMSAYNAMKQGYEVVDAHLMAIRLGYVGEALSERADEIARNLAAATKTQKTLAFTAAVMSLPEAGERPNSAAMIATAYADTWTVDRARSFLRGLPREVANMAGDAPAERRLLGYSNATKIQSRVEIRVAALAAGSARDDLRAREELQNLRYALDCVSHGVSIVDALVSVGFEVAPFDDGGTYA